MPWGFWYFNISPGACLTVGAVISFDPVQVLVEWDVATTSWLLTMTCIATKW